MLSACMKTDLTLEELTRNKTLHIEEYSFPTKKVSIVKFK